MPGAAVRRELWGAAVWTTDWVFAHLYCSWFGLLVYLFTAPLAELYFSGFVRRFVSRRALRQHATHSEHSDAAEAIRMWDLLIESYPGQELAAHFRGWFIGEGTMRRGNVEAVVAWTVFNLAPAACNAEQCRVMERIVGRVESVLGSPLPAGCDPSLVVMSYTHEPWAIGHKPLIVYLLLELFRGFLAVFMRHHGYQLQNAGRLSFWCRPAPDPLRRPRPPPPAPIVLLHGVLGLLPYAILLRVLARTHDGAVLVPIFTHCSITLRHVCDEFKADQPPHDSAELVAAIRTMIARHAPSGTPPRAAFIAHSLGTSFLAPLMRSTPELVVAAAFVDPICFLLPDGAVLKNVLYATPHPIRHTFHWLHRYVVANEATQQDYFRTCWWWAQHWLHPGEICCDSIVMLSGQDSVAEARSVYAHLKGYFGERRVGLKRTRGAESVKGEGADRRHPRVEVLMNESWSHGWLLFQPHKQCELVRKIQLMALAAESAPAKATSPRSVLMLPPQLDEARAIDQTPSFAQVGFEKGDAPRPPLSPRKQKRVSREGGGPLSDDFDEGADADTETVSVGSSEMHSETEVSFEEPTLSPTRHAVW